MRGDAHLVRDTADSGDPYALVAPHPTPPSSEERPAVFANGREVTASVRGVSRSTVVLRPGLLTTQVDCPKIAVCAGEPCRQVGHSLRHELLHHISGCIAVQQSLKGGPF